MSVQLAVVMDPIGSIKPAKDTTLAMLLSAQARGWSLHYTEQGDLYERDGEVRGPLRELHVADDLQAWHRFGEQREGNLADLDVILMRKDPPVDIEYIYTTQLLDRVATSGTVVVNRPQALRDCNEKLFATWFPQCAPPTLVSRSPAALRSFIREQADVVLKPLEGMGGVSVFQLTSGDPNTTVILETMTHFGSRLIMAQKFIPEIAAGDKRILLIDGEPVPYALARVPGAGETRGNLAAGGQGHGVELNERDYWICEQVAPVLKAQGIIFAGIDVIGEYLTEINITSPTCIRELDTLYGLNIADQFLDAVAARLP